MNLVDDDQPNQLRAGPFAALARDDVPFFRRADDQLPFVDLLARQLVIARSFRDLQSVRVQTLGQVADDFLAQRTHRSDGNHLEFVDVDRAVGHDVYCRSP